jgi:hypothetical protein
VSAGSIGQVAAKLPESTRSAPAVSATTTVYDHHCRRAGSERVESWSQGTGRARRRTRSFSAKRASSGQNAAHNVSRCAPSHRARMPGVSGPRAVRSHGRTSSQHLISGYSRPDRPRLQRLARRLIGA